jgi:hypothetical protein
MSRMPRKAAVAAVIAVGLVLVIAVVAVVAAVDGVSGHHVALRPIAHPFPAGVLAAVVLYVVQTTDGQERPVGFDPATLRPTTPKVDRCAARP